MTRCFCRKVMTCSVMRASQIWMALLLFGLAGAGIVVTVADVPAQVAQQCTGPGIGTQPFSFLQSGFSQRLYATAYGACCGAAFAPNGDLWVALGPDEFSPRRPATFFVSARH
jgi:hypothetical protein